CKHGRLEFGSEVHPRAKSADCPKLGDWEYRRDRDGAVSGRPGLLRFAWRAGRTGESLFNAASRTPWGESGGKHCETGYSQTDPDPSGAVGAVKLHQRKRTFRSPVRPGGLAGWTPSLLLDLNNQ